MTNHELYCHDCGLSVPAGYNYCPRCGRELSSVSPATPAGYGGELPSASAESSAEAAGEASDAVPWTIGQIALALLLFLSFLIATGFAVSFIGPLFPEYEAALEAWVAVHLLAAGVALRLWFCGLRQARRPLDALGLVSPRKSWLRGGLLAAAALAFSLAATFLYNVAVDLLELEALRPPDIGTEALFPGAGLLLTFQALALVTPLSEEILFRGYVLRGLLSRIGAGPAVAATALVFSVFHFDTGTVIPIFFTGLALGWLHVKTGSVWPCVVAHAGQNALALLAVRAGI